MSFVKEIDSYSSLYNTEFFGFVVFFAMKLFCMTTISTKAKQL